MKKNIILLLTVLLGLAWVVTISDMVTQPQKIQEHIEKAELYEEKGIYVDAVTEYEAALEYREGDPEISGKMAQAYLNMGDSKNFVSVCKSIAEQNQEDSSALDMLMQYYLDNGYEGKAVTYLNEFVESYPENKNAKKWMLELKGTYTILYTRYRQLSPIVNNSMVAGEEGKYGILSSTGSEMVEVIYEKIYPFSSDGYALAKREDGAWVYLDQEGQTRKVPDNIYTELGMYSEERAVALKDGKYGYLDENMEEKTEFQWEALTGVKDKIAAGKKNGKWALLNRSGKEKTDYIYEDVIIDENGFCSGQKRVFVKENGQYYLVDKSGKQIGEETFDDARVFGKDGYAAVCQDGKWGFINTDGEVVIDYFYEDALSFSNGFAAVCQNGMWTYIDTENHLLLKEGFAYATSLSDEGTATVKMMSQEDEEWTLIQMNIFL